jgi:hypothetical protein
VWSRMLSTTKRTYLLEDFTCCWACSTLKLCLDGPGYWGSVVLFKNTVQRISIVNIERSGWELLGDFLDLKLPASSTKIES